MADRFRPISIEDLPSHLILEILTSGRLSAVDLVYLELSSRTFRGSDGFFAHKLRSLVDFAAFQLCGSHPIYVSMRFNAQKELFDRCGGNWKKILRFLQSVERSSNMVETSAGNVLLLYYLNLFVLNDLSCNFFLPLLELGFCNCLDKHSSHSLHTFTASLQLVTPC